MGLVQFTEWQKYEMKRHGLHLPKIQNTKWGKSNLRNEKNPIYEMRHFILLLKISKIRNGKIQITKWLKQQREMSNLQNGLNSHAVFKKYPIYEMTYIDIVSFRKCPIYEMD